METQAPNVSFERERGVYAIQVTRDVAHAVIAVGDDTLRSSRILQVFRALSDASIPIFLIKMHRAAVTLAFTGRDCARAETTLAAAGVKATTRRDLALIAVRAASMRDLSGVMVEIADALYAAGARLYETGDSHNSVLCLIEAERAAEAVKRLCATFRLDLSCVHESSLQAEEVL
jgi:aspartate kinase